MDTNALSVFSYNGNDITFNSGDGILINATEMAKPFGKRPVDYLRLPSTNELIEAKVRFSHLEKEDLVKTVQGGSNPGTWMQEDIALDFAQWLSVDFRLWCNDRVKELLKRGYVIANPDSFAGQNELLDLKRELLETKEENNKLKYELQSIDLKEQNRIANSYKVYNDFNEERMLLRSQLEDKDTYFKGFFTRFYNVQVNYGHLLQVKRTMKTIREMIRGIDHILEFPDPELPDTQEVKNNSYKKDK